MPASAPTRLCPFRRQGAMRLSGRQVSRCLGKGPAGRVVVPTFDIRACFAAGSECLAVRYDVCRGIRRARRNPPTSIVVNQESGIRNHASHFASVSRGAARPRPCSQSRRPRPTTVSRPVGCDRGRLRRLLLCSHPTRRPGYPPRLKRLSSLDRRSQVDDPQEHPVLQVC